MSKLNLNFNDKNYEIDESALSEAKSSLQSHLSTTMSGIGATINFGGTTYNIDQTKLSTATNNFVSHLGTVSGSGSKVVVGGVEYGVDSSKVANAFEELESAFDSFNSDSNSGGDVITFNGDLSG